MFGYEENFSQPQIHNEELENEQLHEYYDNFFIVDQGNNGLVEIVPAGDSFVVVKSVRTEVTGFSHENEKKKEKLRKEAKLMGLFNSPYIMQCDYNEDQETVSLIMEHCPQGSLSHFLKQGNGYYLKDEGFFVSLLHDILQAIRLLHEKNIVHCDIKCENILLRNDHAVLIDFGESVQVNGTMSSGLIGTPLYLSPEMIHGKVGTFCDIWSFGAVICALGWAATENSNDPSLSPFPNPWNQPIANEETFALIWRIGNGDRPEIPSWFSPGLKKLTNQCFLPAELRPTASQLLETFFMD